VRAVAIGAMARPLGSKRLGVSAALTGLNTMREQELVRPPRGRPRARKSRAVSSRPVDIAAELDEVDIEQLKLVLPKDSLREMGLIDF